MNNWHIAHMYSTLKHRHTCNYYGNTWFKIMLLKCPFFIMNTVNLAAYSELIKKHTGQLTKINTESDTVEFDCISVTSKGHQFYLIMSF